MITGETANAEIALTLGRDISLFRDLTQALLAGSDTLRISPASDSETVRACRNSPRSTPTSRTDQRHAHQPAGAGPAKDANCPSLPRLGTVAQQVADWHRNIGTSSASAASTSPDGHLGILMLLTRGADRQSAARRRAQTRSRSRKAAREAMGLEEEAKRSNEQNQAAILRLMNELQEVADGNLTVQATVTEDITGAIADSRQLHGRRTTRLVGRSTSRPSR